MVKVILITGCSSGFGYLTAKLLSSNGHIIYAGVRNEKDLKIFNQKNIKPILLDVTWSQDKINKVIEVIKSNESKIDVLINNAGFGFLGVTGSFSVEELKEQFETNVFGVFKTTKAVLPYMRKQKRGLVINISSIAGIQTSAFYGVYSASKFALEALATSMRAEESLYNIDFVSVNPGSHVTKFWENVKFPKELELFNKLMADKINSKLARFRADPMNVTYTIERIINTERPRKNYLVGLSAYLLSIANWLLPYGVIDFVSKKVMVNLGKKG